MQVDSIRAIATYTIAFVVVLGGFFVLYATRGDATATDTRVVIGGFVGFALNFVFGQETATRATRATSAALVNGNAVREAATNQAIAKP